MVVLVYLEERNGQIRKPSLEAINAAQALGASSIVGCFVGADAVAEQAKSLPLSNVFSVGGAEFNTYSSRAAAKAVAEVAKQTNANVVLVPATSRGKDLAPRVAVRLEAGYIPDVINFQVNGEEIIASHPVYAGKATVAMKVNTPVKVFSTRPNLWKPVKDQGNSQVSQVSVPVSESELKERTTELKLSQGKLDVAEADIIVSAGRGMKGPEHWKLIEDLASAFGAAIGASRAVVDAGWRPHSEQVGQTGKTVSPTLYVAVGISGAVQHLAGMSSSKTIVAINKDPNAPIFNIADYGIVGDVFEILPPLTEEIKRLRG